MFLSRLGFQVCPPSIHLTSLVLSASPPPSSLHHHGHHGVFNPAERHRLQPAHLRGDQVQRPRHLRGAARRRCRFDLRLQAGLPGRILRGHGERGVKSAADSQRARRHPRPAGRGCHLRQTEAEAETLAQVQRNVAAASVKRLLLFENKLFPVGANKKKKTARVMITILRHFLPYRN